jgi:hypothetical protein
MELLRFKTKPSNRQIIVQLPPQVDADLVEVLVRTAEEPEPRMGRRRRPPERLRGTVIHDNLISPAVPEGEWDALQ